MQRNVLFTAVWFAMTAVALTGCGDDGTATSSTATRSSSPSPSGAGSADAAADALRAQRRDLAGMVTPEAVAKVAECSPRGDDSTVFACTFGQGVGGEDPSTFVLRLAPDGTVTKVLGGKTTPAGATSPAQTAVLLAADDEFQAAPSRSTDYRCEASPQLAPSGRRTASDAVGQLCSARLRVGNRDIRRYVELAPDGTARRDYLIRDG